MLVVLSRCSRIRCWLLDALDLGTSNPPSSHRDPVDPQVESAIKVKVESGVVPSIEACGFFVVCA